MTRALALILALLASLPAAADMYPDASNAKQPEASQNLQGNSGVVYAKQYGNCPWTAAGDNSPCINAAIAAAKASVTTAPDFFLTGGGTVILPEGDIGIGGTIQQTTSPGITIRGAGAPGAYGYCKTRLSWTGSAGGTMVAFGDESTSVLVGGGLEGLCIDGGTQALGTGAGVGVKMRSAAYGKYEDVNVARVQAAAWDVDVSAANTNGVNNNYFTQVRIGLDTAGSINADGWRIGPGTSSHDTYGNQWVRSSVQYQNGIGIKCGNSDSNLWQDIWVQPIAGGTGRSLQLEGSAAGPANMSECRENVFSGWFGSNIASTAPIAKTNTHPSFANWITQNARGSATLVPEVEAGATARIDTNDGAHSDNRNAAEYWTQGKMAYRPNPGNNGAVFDIDTGNLNNFAQVAKFGPAEPVYLHYGGPVIGMNAYWGSGAFRYGKGSAAKYGGTLGYNTATGTLGFAGATAAGNADASITPSDLWAIDRFGHERVSNRPAPALTACGTTPAISGDDRAGEITMGTGSPAACTVTFANAYTGVPYCTVTWQTNLAVMAYVVAASGFGINQTATSSNKVNYRCTARSGG